jgi:hypothetical protein
MSVLTNVQVKVTLPPANVAGGPSLTKQVTVLISSAVSLADAEAQALVLQPTAIKTKATLPIVLGTKT